MAKTSSSNYEDIENGGSEYNGTKLTKNTSVAIYRERKMTLGISTKVPD